MTKSTAKVLLEMADVFKKTEDLVQGFFEKTESLPDKGTTEIDNDQYMWVRACAHAKSFRERWRFFQYLLLCMKAKWLELNPSSRITKESSLLPHIIPFSSRSSSGFEITSHSKLFLQSSSNLGRITEGPL